MNKSTTETFVKKMQKKYGDVYDYSQVNYVNASTPVTIVCKQHGLFTKTPNMLLRGYVCNQCLAEQRSVSEADKKADYAKRAAKRKQTLQARYGVDNPMQLDSVKEKIKRTCMERYGVENPRQSDVVIEKARQTNVERYGEISYAKSKEGLAQIQKTMQERYGSDNFMKSDAHFAVAEHMKEKSRQTQLERYGTEHYSQSEEAKRLQSIRKEKEYDTKRKNHSFCVSFLEEELEQRLKQHFGVNDVVCQFSSDVYPFLCDFYIPSRDMYIELNATWTHGHHWYHSNPIEDDNVLQFWHEKGTEYYQNAIQTWTERDVKKRQIASQNRLNYVVFWYDDLQDVDLWFGMNCPDGQDWNREYSWLPQRVLTFDCTIFEKQTATQASMLAKQYQFPVFYHRELAMWNQNALYKGVPVQAFLYINRYHYLKKLPHELSNMALLSGFSIAGIIKNYTKFDYTLMERILQNYNDIDGIYDPFAGWGERMLCAHNCGQFYVGYDINQHLYDGYTNMIRDLVLQGVMFEVQDSTNMEMPCSCDTVITCPPYHNIERYTSEGLETLSYMSFLDKWRTIVGHCCVAKYFCFQINQKLRNDMTAIVEDAGFELVQELSYDKVSSSHFTRKNGVNHKKEYESMLVFKNIKFK